MKCEDNTDLCGYEDNYLKSNQTTLGDCQGYLCHDQMLNLMVRSWYLLQFIGIIFKFLLVSFLHWKLAWNLLTLKIPSHQEGFGSLLGSSWLTTRNEKPTSDAGVLIKLSLSLGEKIIIQD